MENITKANLKDIVKDLHAELKATIASEFESWKPAVDKQISGLQLAVDLLQQHVFTDKPEDAEEASAQADPDLAARRGVPHPGILTDIITPRANGLGVASPPRTAVEGVLATPTAPPVNGTVLHPQPSSPMLGAHTWGQLIPQGVQQPPSMPFPVFDGENPYLWKDLCEQYFAVYSVQECYWVYMATLNFSPTTGVWLQSVRKKLLTMNWEGLCSVLCTRFGKDRHQLLIRKFYSIRQTSTVQDYIDRFEYLMNQLLSYSDAIHPYYFLMRFVGGLKPELRAAVMIQRPQELDTACSLALVQEEVQEGSREEFGRYNEMPPRFSPRHAVLKVIYLQQLRIDALLKWQDHQPLIRGKHQHQPQITWTH